MTVKQLIEELKNMKPDSEVVIQLWGGLRGNCAEITSATNGFDWFHGKTVLDTDRPVARWKRKSEQCSD